MRKSRREFVRQASGAAAMGLASWSSRAAVARPNDPPQPGGLVRFGPDLEPLVRLIEDAPREKCPELLAEKVKGGLTDRGLLAAAFLAAVRKLDSGHAVYLVDAAHQASLDLPQGERLLPLFWAVDHFKWQQLAWPGPALPPLAGDLPAAERAAPDLHAAMRRQDTGGAERGGRRGARMRRRPASCSP